MKCFGLIGHPLGHSYSKVYFTEKFEREGVDACYELFDLSSIDELPRLLTTHPDLRGFNVTVPYKETILPFMDGLDEVAKEVGAVNTVKVMDDGRLKGFNTDVIGVVATDVASRWGAEDYGGSALILGTGGASKAVQYVLKKRGIPFHLVSRNPEKGHFTYESLIPEVINEHLLIINATPVGMAPHIEEAPMIPYEAITPQHILFDLIYNPEETRFLRMGRECGAVTMNGLTMLHAQADAAWDVWNSSSLRGL